MIYKIKDEIGCNTTLEIERLNSKEVSFKIEGIETRGDKQIVLNIRDIHDIISVLSGIIKDMN